ncbi:hypothetical protein O181_057065 [Austropuccinia psidii MF-1]|uniref:Uncharacterized protein n=1 Tax=Austropuccinia psidii MF-1 TaxID=1389203 RepID=A0A9Q3E790_9BASI|nr:hypothetical protein [Austropuccinia psidii MF-1]
MAWKSLRWADSTSNEKKRLNLVFSLFIDWFNPHGNKLLGKQVSLGCLILTCLNLPPVLRTKPAFTLLYGILPGRNSPHIITISNSIKPFVDELLILKDGFTVNTNQEPQGRKVFVQPLPIIGDLVAIHKAVGFGSHLAKQFCGWCKSELNDLQHLKQGEKRMGVDILEQAKAWKDSKTLSVQEDLHKRTGVRWSELNQLPYWIPKMHIALGVMHNWLEGVLAEHFRNRWGFQDQTQDKKKGKNRVTEETKTSTNG